MCVISIHHYPQISIPTSLVFLSMLSRYLWSKKKGGPKKDKEITLTVEGETESVRRSALIKHSAVFRKMADDGELKSSKEIRLKGVTVTALHKIVE